MRNEIIDVPFVVIWQAPVRIRAGAGYHETIRGPEDALQFLTYRWPTSEGQHFDAARRTCVRALQKRAACEDARVVFVSAAIEASMLA